MKSILQTEKECFITKSTVGLHKHHLYPAANRKLSERYGLWVYLRWDWHNGKDYGVHYNRELDLWLKQIGQSEFERQHTREEFTGIFGRNYL